MPWSARLVPILARCGWPGRWLIGKLGWREFIKQTVTRQHAADCRGADVRYEPRPQGHVRRCAGCGLAVEMHFACWETDDGFMPPEVVRWMAEEIRIIANKEGLCADSST